MINCVLFLVYCEFVERAGHFARIVWSWLSPGRSKKRNGLKPQPTRLSFFPDCVSQSEVYGRIFHLPVEAHGSKMTVSPFVVVHIALTG